MRIPVILTLGASLVLAQFPVGPQAARAAGPNAIVQLLDATGKDQCQANILARNDDLSTPTAVSLGFALDFFGKSYSSAYVNNNGNITFDSPLGIYTPFPLVGQSRAIVAPFFGDVDTRNTSTTPVTYSFGTASFQGHAAFCVDWVNVGYYNQHADKLNSFQLLLVDRADIGAGNFDIIFNYDQVQWETGDASGGTNGLGGNSARVGYSNGSTAALEIAGSAVNGALLDSNASGLIKRSRGTDQLGRLIFPVRNGGITMSTGSAAMNLVGTAVSFNSTITEAGTSVAGRAVTFTVTGANPRSLQGTTDAGGAVAFTYTGAASGTDTVLASFTDTAGAVRSTKPLIRTWIGADQVAGIAQCLTQKVAPAKNPGTITTTLLPSATLTFTPALAIPLTADANGSFLFSGLTPSTKYTVQYAATLATPALGSRLVTCQTTFTTNASGGAMVPSPTPFPNYGNHTWLHPFPLNGTPNANGSVNDLLTAPFQKTWYKVTVAPHQRVTVTLDHLTRNYTLTAYTNLAALAAKIKLRAGTLVGVAAIHSQGDISAGDLDSGDLDSGDLDSGDLDSGDLDSGDLDSGDLDSGDLDSGDLDSGDLDSGDLDSGDLDSGDLDSSAGVYGTAQRLGRRAFSAHGGLAPESITLNTRGYGGDVYFRVGGHSGAYDTGNTFTLTLTGIVPTDASCNTAPITAAHFTGAAVSPVGNPTTLILTNTARLGTLLGTPTPGPIAVADRPAFDTALAALAARPEVNGVVADLAAPAFALPFSAAFAEWDAHAACALEANAVAGAVHDVIDVYRKAYPSIRYLVFAGGHQAVPFYSQVDRAEISREWRFSPPLDGMSAGEAALASGYYLTDDYYATTTPIDRFGHLQFVPELATGRLVESSADIVTAINSYVARAGTIVAGSAPSLSAGYTFNSDLATAITNELTAAGQTVDTSLNNDTWTAAQLRSTLLPAVAPPHYSVIGLQAHFSANRLVPADNLERVLSTEFATNGSFDGTLFASIGCHLGYNIVDTYGIPTITRTRSFPEILLSRGATLVGNTGYGYADDVLLKSSEDLILKFTHELRYSQDASLVAYAGGTPLGDALRNAKLQYLTMPNMRGIDEKVVGEATLYGLPMSAITLPIRIPRPTANVLLTTPVPAVAGLSTTTLDQSFNLVRSALGAGGSSFYSVDGDLSKTVATPLRPIGPALAIDVTAKESSLAGPDTLARGWVILEGDASIVSPFVPRISLPATQDATPSTANYINGSFTPTRPGALSVLTRPTFQFQPFQYLSNSTGSSGTARTYSREQVKLYFSRATDAAALAEAPLVYNVALTDLSAGTTHKVHVDVAAGYAAGAGIADLWLTYTTNGGLSFRSVPTTLGAASLNGSAATCGTSCGFVVHGTADIDTGTGLASTLQLFVQAVGNNALVTSATNTGRLYSLALQNAADAPPMTATTVSAVTAPTTATYLSRINVSATLSAGATKLAGKTLTFKLGRSRATATTDANGVATASVLVNVSPSSGAQSVTVSFAGDATYAGSGAASAPVTVTAAPTTLLAAGPLQSGESGPVGTLVLPDHANAPLADQMISLVPGGNETATTYTTGDGVARLDAGDFSAPLAAGLLDVRYGGDPGGRYGPSSRTIPIYDPTKAVAAAGSVTAGGQKATFGFALKYLGAPSVAPATGGSLGQGEYRVGYSFASSFAETALGATAKVSVGPNGAISVAAITGIPADKISVRFYFTSAPVGQRTGFVVSRPVSKGTMAAFTITAGPATASAAASAPTGGLAMRIQNAATGATTGSFLVAGTPGGFDWLVITGSPSSQAVFEGTGSYTTPSTPFTPVRRHFRVVVDKPANTFAITIDATGALPAITISGTVSPLPLDDEPSASGIVFR